MVLTYTSQVRNTAQLFMLQRDEDCCEVLLEAGADINAVGGPYGTPLQAAAWAKDMESVRVLLNAGADITVTEPISGEYGTALQAACAAGCFDIVQELLRHGAAVNVGPANGKFGGALSAAAAGGFEKTVKLLIEHHADVNASGGLHGFPILAAARSGVLLVVQRLLDHGANASALGGLLGSTIAAAVGGSNLEILLLLIANGANVHAKGGKYGDALQTAAMKADVSIIDELLNRAVELVNHQAGKYHTALIAASYFNRLDVVVKLLDAGADFRVQGGTYRSAISAASIRGNKIILDKFLAMKPPDYLLDEALVEGCAYRQSACVDALLKAGADVYTKHPTRGSATEALDLPEEELYNSDLEDDDDDDNENEDEEEEATEGDEWEGDDVSVGGQTDEDSVTDLELDEELSEEAKIRKMLKEAQDRCRRNPTVKRFRTVKHREVPTCLSIGVHRRPSVPPFPLTAEPVTSSIYRDSMGVRSLYAQCPQELWSLPSSLRSGSVRTATHHDRTILPPPVPSYGGYPAPLFAQSKVQSPPPLPEQMGSPMEDLQQQYPASSLVSERQNSPGSVSSDPQPNSTPLRNKITDHVLKRQSDAVNRKSIAKWEALSRFHQPRQSTPSLDRSISKHDYAAPGHQVASPPPQHGSPSKNLQGKHTGLISRSHLPQLLSQQPQQACQAQSWMSQGPLQQQSSPCASQLPPILQHSYASYPHQSAASSPASVQSSQYMNTDSQYTPWDTPNSSTSTFSNTRGQDEDQWRRWDSGGYDGEGYE